MTEPDPLVDEVPEEALDDWADEPGGQTGGVGSVRGNHNISVTDPQGSVFIMKEALFLLESAAGDGDLDATWSPRLVPEDILTGLAKRFVIPSGYGDLLARLRDPGTVVVSGAPGSGRRSAALMVLKDSGEGTTRFRELPDDDVDGQFVLDVSVIEPGERLLLDMSAEVGPLPQRLLTNLRAYRAAVADRRAYLAIVLPPEQEQVAAELGSEATIIGRPDGVEVFRQHLAGFGIVVTGSELRNEALQTHLTRDPMRDIAALARRVQRERSTAAGQGGLVAWLTAALETDTYLDDAARFMRDNADGRVRALLLASAVFEHATPEVVESAAARFLEVTKYPPHEGHRLDLPDLAEALARVHARIDGGQVRFDSVAYADAVRTHFWRTFPDLRDDLRQWLDRTVRSGAMAPTSRSLAVLRYTDQCLRIGHPEDLWTLVEQWAAHPPSTSDKLLDVAGAALARCLLDERYGWRFRRRVYRWVRNRQLWPSLAVLLIGLCESVIAPARPHQGLVRLRHLTRHVDSAIVTAARAALARLCGDGRFARRMLTRTHDDLTGDHPRDVDYVLFTDVADPVRLTAGELDGFPRVTERVVRGMLVGGWAVWLANRPYDDTAVAVTRWLDAHAEAPGRDTLLEILAAATRRRSPRRAVLYAVSRDWVAAAPPEQRQARLHTAAVLRQACAEVPQPFATQGVSH
ncbi:hypothetical protein [Actinophytocola sp.]|uniref:hypothetical protein n=1 Tax=Actinophytocola sp. TaxID=1872138 RepID=UPI002ED46330